MVFVVLFSIIWTSPRSRAMYCRMCAVNVPCSLLTTHAIYLVFSAFTARPASFLATNKASPSFFTFLCRHSVFMYPRSHLTSSTHIRADLRCVCATKHLQQINAERPLFTSVLVQSIGLLKRLQDSYHC
jgi:hypothetical protein